MTEKEILARTLYFEAGSTENIEDVLAVAWVIRNRVEKGGWYGNNYYEVCLKHKQFSCWNNRNPETAKIPPNDRWMNCIFVAGYVMKSKPKWNPLPEVTHYFNANLCDPYWAREMQRMTYDPKLDHVFYRKKKRR